MITVVERVKTRIVEGTNRVFGNRAERIAKRQAGLAAEERMLGTLSRLQAKLGREVIAHEVIVQLAMRSDDVAQLAQEYLQAEGQVHEGLRATRDLRDMPHEVDGELRRNDRRRRVLNLRIQLADELRARLSEPEDLEDLYGELRELRGELEKLDCAREALTAKKLGD